MINPWHYDHLQYIAAAYALFLGATLYFTIGAQRRLSGATRRLRAIDKRAR